MFLVVGLQLLLHGRDGLLQRVPNGFFNGVFVLSISSSFSIASSLVVVINVCRVLLFFFDYLEKEKSYMHTYIHTYYIYGLVYLSLTCTYCRRGRDKHRGIRLSTRAAGEDAPPGTAVRVGSSR